MDGVMLEQNKARLKEKIAQTPQETIAQMDKNWLKQLKSHPEEEQVLVIGHLSMILTLSTHRFGSHIPKFLDSWIKKYRRKKRQSVAEFTDKECDEACSEITSFIENLKQSLDTYYRGLLDFSPNTNHYCHMAIEDRIFSRISDDILPMFRSRYKQDDEKYQRTLNDLRNVSAAHLGIPKLFWLLPEGDEGESILPPYTKAINALQQIAQHCTPTSKINCLIQTADAIVSCVLAHWKGKKNPSELVIGGDEFLPIFTFICIRAAIPNLSSESALMQAFISEISAISQGGYLLVTLQTCLAFMSKLQGKDLENNAAEVFLMEEKREREQKRKKEQEELDNPTKTEEQVTETQNQVKPEQVDLISFD